MSAEKPIKRKRSHKKSRKGCIGCKAKHIKCDERVPTCSNCGRRGEQCSYPKPPVWAQNTFSEGETTRVNDHAEDESQTKSQTSELAVLDRFSQLPRCPLSSNFEVSQSALLAEYYHCVGPGIASGNPTKAAARAWCSAIPSLGFQHSAVFEAILAVSAVSLCRSQLGQSLLSKTARDQSTNAITKLDFDNFCEPFLRQAHIHYGKCLAALQEELSSFSKENAEVALASSVLLIPYNLAHLQLDRFRQRLPRSSSQAEEGDVCHQCGDGSLDLSWINFTHGLGKMVNDLARQGPFWESDIIHLFRWIQKDTWYGPFRIPLLSSETRSPEDSPALGHPMLPVILAEGHKSLEKLENGIQAILVQQTKHCSGEMRGAHRTQICLEELSNLKIYLAHFDKCAVAYYNEPYFRILMLWISRVSPSFMDLLSQDHPMALAIYAHWICYMILLEDLWYVGDLGIGSLQTILPLAYGCNACGSSASCLDPQYQTLFSWPVKILRLANGVKH